MDLKIPSAMVERQMFPKHTNKTEMGSVDILADIGVAYQMYSSSFWSSRLDMKAFMKVFA